MAKVTLGPGGVYAYRGKVGDHVYKHHRGGTILCRKPDMSGIEPSESQRVERSHFARAVAYAKAAKTEPIYREAARKTRRTAYHLALSDFRTPPEVDEIDLSDYAGASGDVITIFAWDDRQVASVYVRLRDASGAVLEEGAAELDYGARWLYTARVSITTSKVRVEATATDLPGGTHTGVKEIQVAGIAGESADLRPQEDERLGLPPAAEEEVRKSVDRVRRRLMSPDVRRARHRGQHKGSSPELRQDAAPAREVVESLSSSHEDRDVSLHNEPLSSPAELSPEHVRLALTLLLAERLLRMRGEDERKTLREKTPPRQPSAGGTGRAKPIRDPRGRDAGTPCSRGCPEPTMQIREALRIP